MAKLKPSVERLLALASIAVCALLALLIFNLSSSETRKDRLRRPSSYFSDSSGSRACFLVLQQLFPSVERWLRPTLLLRLLEESQEVSVLVALGPTLDLTENEADVLDSWIESGGWLVLALDARPWNVAPPVRNPGKKGEKTSYLTRHGFEVTEGTPEEDASAVLRLEGHVLSGEGFEPLAQSSQGVLAAFKLIGQGRLVVIPDALAFSNQRLKSHPGNMSWLASVLAERGGGRIAFDEYHHGFGRQRGFLNLLWSFFATPWGWACLQIGAAGLLYLLGTRRRFGEAAAPPPPTRRSPAALIEARAGLFQSAQARGLALQLIERHRQRRRRASVRSPRNPSEEMPSEDAINRLAMKDADLVRLARSND